MKTDRIGEKFTTNEGCIVEIIGYKNCSADERWYNFQNFAKWMEDNYNFDYMDNNWHLDKDILQKGNKVYSPETCCFVPNEINSFFCKR